jgi:hypothetical protein
MGTPEVFDSRTDAEKHRGVITGENERNSRPILDPNGYPLKPQPSDDSYGRDIMLPPLSKVKCADFI